MVVFVTFVLLACALSVWFLGDPAALVILAGILLLGVGVSLWAAYITARWVWGLLQRRLVSVADERRFRSAITSSISVSEEDQPVAELDGVEGDVQVDTAVAKAFNAMNRRRHPLGYYRLDSPLTRRAVAHIKSNVVVEHDTPANRMVLTRHFQTWARERGLRSHNIRFFTPVVLEAFFLKTDLDRDMELLRASDAYRENQMAELDRIRSARIWRTWFGFGRRPLVRAGGAV